VAIKSDRNSGPLSDHDNLLGLMRNDPLRTATVYQLAIRIGWEISKTQSILDILCKEGFIRKYEQSDGDFYRYLPPRMRKR
jgi:DNA-binding MarR family transcriptional regulator